MPADLISEDELRACLRPHRPDPADYAAAVHRRVSQGQSQRAADPLSRVSPWLRSAAALLPLPLIVPAKVAGVAGKAATAGGGSKLLSYMAFPAISLFVLAGATLFSLNKIRSIRSGPAGEPMDEAAQPEAVRQWWRDHKWGARLVYVVTLLLYIWGATWLLYVAYVISLGLLAVVLASLSKVGLGNRQVVGSSCLTGLMLLGQIAMFPSVGDGEIHFIDQRVVAVVFYIGTGVLAVCLGLNAVMRLAIVKPRFRSTARRFMTGFAALLGAGVAALLSAGLIVWILRPLFQPVTPARINEYVESFDQAPFQSSSWQQWEISARWCIDAGLKPDLTRPRRLLDEEVRKKENLVLPFILGSAMRVGLVDVDQLPPTADMANPLERLLSEKATRPVASPRHVDWVIRAAAAADDLTDADRDRVQQRLHLNLIALTGESFDGIEEALMATQLLAAIDRPVDKEEFRPRIHDLLRELHCTRAGGFHLAGGFKRFPASRVADMNASAYAVQLMEIYGVPDNLDFNWVRSYFKPLAFRPGADKWIAAVSRERLEKMPGVLPVSWWDTVYYERSLLAAIVLVGLCLFATLTSPPPVPRGDPLAEGRS
jgi:hypothetical protein